MHQTIKPPEASFPDLLDRDGVCLIPAICSDAHCDDLLAALGQGTARAGSRCLLEHPAVRSMADHLRTHPQLRPLMPTGAVAVQCSLFAKSPAINWSVAPHQDLSIPVAEHVDDAACSGWSSKEGMVFTQPPASILASLLAVRLQLDPDAAVTGPLQVLRGSHRWGRLPLSAIGSLWAGAEPLACVVPRGGVVALRPLTVHASSKATQSGLRRVLHFLFGPPYLPLGLRWARTHARIA